MPMPPHGRTFLRVESLETRETPAALVAETFEDARFPYLPGGWQQWASNNQEYYGLTRTAATSGTQALAIYGNTNLQSRFWNSTSLGGNVTVWANIKADTIVPVTAFARGQNLNATTASYVGVAVGRGGAIQLRESRNGTEATIVGVTPTEPVNTDWLRLSFTLIGESAMVRLQRIDDGRFLNSRGGWQVDPADVIQANVTVRAANGSIGLSRGTGPYGTIYVDDVAGIPIGEDIGATVPAGTVPPPVPNITEAATVQKYSHIRLAQLAYNGTPITDFEKKLLQNSLDLIVPNPKFLGTLEQASATTPKLIYSNVSNLYQTLLTDWLSYADRTGSPREAAFYHVQRATAFTGSSPSSQPVTWFWNVSRSSATGDTDLTANARGGRTTGATFGGAGEAVNIGYTDKFRELNVKLVRGAKADWSGVWEYATANGWKTLSIQTDGTGTLRNDGTIVFDPPADWVTTRTSPTASLYTIRFRTTTGTATTAPEAKTLFGRDYVNSAGTAKGTIPAFDSAADLDRDGYLKDSEYAKRRHGLDARFNYESRLFYPYYGQMRFVVNPASSTIKNWATEYHARQLAENPLADGLFLDNANGKLPFAGTPVLEPTATFSTDTAALIATVRNGIGGKLLLANTSGARTEANAVTKAAGIAFEEFAIRPTEANWTQVGDLANLIGQRLAAGNTSVVIDSHPGSTAMIDPRTLMGVLSYYYLIADPQRTYLMFHGGVAPAASWQQKWTPAAAINVGKPTGTLTTFATGTDPQNAALQYRVLSREYADALVLFKPRSYTLRKGTGTTNDATATTHVLNGSYRELRADGTLGPTVRQVTLRNGEGAVMMKVK